MIPLGPRTTCSISIGPGKQVATTSHAAASAAGESAHCAPAASNGSARSGRTSWIVSPWPARRNWPAIGRPMLPTPMNPTFTVLQRVESVDVVPEDLPLAGVADGERQEAVHGLGVLGVAVGVIGGRDQIVVAEGIHHVLDELLR